VTELWIWNALLTIVCGIMGWIARSKFEQLDKVEALLNKTREEAAKQFVDRREMMEIVNRLGDRMDRSVNRLEDKLDKALNK